MTSVNFFDADFRPGMNDVMIGRGKKCSKHSGNEKLRSIVASKLIEYSAAKTKNEKSIIILSVVAEIRGDQPSGNFIKQDSSSGLWFNVGDFLAREKVSQTFRDSLHQEYRSSNEFKKKRRRKTPKVNQQTPPILPRTDLSKLAQTNAQMQSNELETKNGSDTNLVAQQTTVEFSELGVFSQGNPFEPIPIFDNSMRNDPIICAPLHASLGLEDSVFGESLLTSFKFDDIFENKSDDAQFNCFEKEEHKDSNQKKCLQCLPSQNRFAAQTA